MHGIEDNGCWSHLVFRSRKWFCRFVVTGIIFTSSAALLSLPAISQAVTQNNSQENTQATAGPEITVPQVNANLPEIKITENDGVYQINIMAWIDAPARFVRDVLTDFIHIYRLNPSIIESDVLTRHDDGAVSVRTRILGCVAYLCEELERVEKVSLLPSGDLLAEIVPELSHFNSGQTLWRIKSLGEQSVVSYTASVEPKVFIPPLVGNFMVEKSITKEMQTSLANLEKIARILAERQWQENYQPGHNFFTANDPCVAEVEYSYLPSY
jgi:hypothetical protein